MVTVDVSDWLNLSDAAKILGVHPSTLRAWADDGELPTHRTPGMHRRFRRVDVESFAEARREAQQSAGQMIIQNALGRTRMRMAEGAWQKAPWYTRMDEEQKQQFRETGRTLLTMLLRYLGDEGEAVLDEAREMGRSHERLGRAAGLSLLEKVSLFLYFRDFLYDSVIDVYQAAGQRAAREWAQMHRRIAAFTNVALLALIESHEQPDQP